MSKLKCASSLFILVLILLTSCEKKEDEVFKDYTITEYPFTPMPSDLDTIYYDIDQDGIDDFYFKREQFLWMGTYQFSCSMGYNASLGIWKPSTDYWMCEEGNIIGNVEGIILCGWSTGASYNDLPSVEQEANLSLRYQAIRWKKDSAYYYGWMLYSPAYIKTIVFNKTPNQQIICGDKG